MEDLRFYSKYLALAVAILGTIKYKDMRNSKAKYFLFSIWYIVATEFIGAKFYSWFDRSNYIVYNIYTIVQFVFYLWWFRSLLKLKKRKQIVSAFIIIFILFSIINSSLFQNIMSEATSYNYALGVIFLVTTICYYFIEVFNSEKVLKIRSSAYFWFSLGLLLFHATFMPFYFAFDYFLIDNLKFLSVVNFSLCVIMYTCFIIGFIKLKSNHDEHKLT